MRAPYTFHTGKTSACRQNFWTAALSARPLSRLPDRRDGARGRKTPLTSLCQQLKLCSGLPQATSPRPQESALVGPRLCHRFGAREVVGRAIVKRRAVHGPRPQSWKGSDSGARARSEGDWAELASRSGCRGTGERVALRKPRTRRSLAPPVRARGRHNIFSSGPPSSFTSASRGGEQSREVWGEVGGTSHASAASQRREGEGEILDNVTPSTPNREPA